MPGPIANRPLTGPSAAAPASTPRAAPASTPYAAFAPTGTQPSTWNKKAIEFSGTVDGRAVNVSLHPPGTTFWKGDRSVFINSAMASYDEAQDLAASLRKAGWTGVADLIAKQPTPQAPFANFRESQMTSQNSVRGTLQRDAFTFTGKLAPGSDAAVRYEPTPDGKGKVFLTVTGGALATPERELNDAERYQLAERIVHGDNGRVRQAADFISPAAVSDWKRRVPGGTAPAAGPVMPTVGEVVVKPATSWLQDLLNRLTR